MVGDIGYLIFVELLQMTQYPGAPFTGNIIRDLVMFLFIPSVFIIVFIYALTGFIGFFAGKIRLLMGIALYLFIIAGGYYSAFALIAGPYFIFLIFVIGLIYFLPSHFGVRRKGHGMPVGATAEAATVMNNPYVGWNLIALERELRKKKEMLADVEKQIEKEEARLDKLIEKGSRGVQLKVGEGAVEQLKVKRMELRNEITQIEYAMGIVKGKF